MVTNNENQICEEVTYIRNKKVIEGYENLKGEKVAGLIENNLRYYVCDFVGRENSEENKRLLTAQSTDLLKIRENCYEEQTFATISQSVDFENLSDTSKVSDKSCPRL